MNIIGLRVVWELRGTPCISLENQPRLHKSILASRSFGRPIKEIPLLKEAVSSHINRACEKLRKEGSVATTLCIALRTVKNEVGYYEKHQSMVSLKEASADTRKFIQAGLPLIKKIIRPGCSYKKAGVLLLNLSPATSLQTGLFAQSNKEKPENLMNAMDHLNQKLGRKTVFWGAEGIDPVWKMRSNFCSPKYTTSWDDLPIVK